MRQRDPSHQIPHQSRHGRAAKVGSRGGSPFAGDIDPDVGFGPLHQYRVACHATSKTQPTPTASPAGGELLKPVVLPPLTAFLGRFQPLWGDGSLG